MININNTSWIPDDLYRQIINVMPIPCVDLIARDGKDRILMLKRKNEPAKGQWWLPGGRVYIGETRIEAAKRKLVEECGLDAICLEEMGTFDIIYPDKVGQACTSHGISTVFVAVVSSDTINNHNRYGADIKWGTIDYWLELADDKNLHGILVAYAGK